MQLSFLSRFLTDEMIKAISWTLVHSAWQGLIAAAIAGIIILTTKHSSARLRYNLLGAVMIAFMMVVSFTFISLQGAPLSIASPGTVLINDVPVNSLELPLSVAGEESWTTVLIAKLNRHADKLVLFWALFMLLNFARLGAGYGSARRLCRHRVSQAPLKWALRMRALATSLGISRHIILLESGLVKVPSAVGVFKPVILFPVGLLTQLPPEQVETVLLHELAHIRRRDYLVNLLQRFAESIFFFNPSILWISSRLRQEREACCDDIVVAHTGCRTTYLQALVNFQEQAIPASSYAMAISTRPQHLLHRVKRMLTQENKKLNTMEKILLVAGLSAAMAFNFAPRTNNGPGPREPLPSPVTFTPTASPVYFVTEAEPTATAATTAVNKVRPGKAVIVQDTTKKKKTATGSAGFHFNTINTYVNEDGSIKKENISATDKQGKKYSIQRLNGELTGFMVDDRQIPASEMSAYTDIIRQIDEAVENHRAGHQAKMKEHEAKMAEHRKQLADSRKKIEAQRKVINRQREEQAQHRLTLQRRQIERDQVALNRRYEENMRKERVDREMARQRYERENSNLQRRRIELQKRQENESRQRQIRQKNELERLEERHRIEAERQDKLRRTTRHELREMNTPGEVVVVTGKHQPVGRVEVHHVAGVELIHAKNIKTDSQPLNTATKLTPSAVIVTPAKPLHVMPAKYVSVQ